MNERQKNHILQKVSRSIPQKLADNVTKTVVDTSGEDMAREALTSRDIPNSKKRMIEKALKEGKFRTEETVVNEEVVKRIDAHNEREVRRLIESGKLPDPMTDKFYRERVERQRRGDIRKQPPMSKEELRRNAAQVDPRRRR